MRLDQLCEHYRDSRIELRDNSYEQIQVAVRLFSRWLGREADVSDLTKANLIAWLRHLSQAGRAGRTVNGKRAHLLSLWNFAADEGLLDPPPRRVPRATEECKAPRAWLTADVDEMLAVAPSATSRRGWAGPEWTALILLLWDTALRISTALRLKPSHLEIDADGVGWINTPGAIQKGKRATRHRLHADTLQAIRDMRAATTLDTADALLPWPYPLRDVQRHFSEQILEPAGLLRPGVPKFHGFRRASYSYVAASLGIERASTHAAHRSNLSRAYADPRIVEQGNVLDVLPRPEVRRA